MPGPVCSAACSVASPISHASGISARREDELDRLVEIEGVVHQDDERREADRDEERATDHEPAILLAGGQSLDGSRAPVVPENSALVKSCGATSG